MSLPPKKFAWFSALLPVFIIVGVVSTVMGIVAYTSVKKDGMMSLNSAIPRLFTESYPLHPPFQEELKLMRHQGKLSPENEQVIEHAIDLASEKLHMPKATLWCLLFQESRLNHLANINTNKAASGIGQFSYFSFYEVNHHLDRYGAQNLDLFITALGRDVRPIEAKRSDIHHPSSYYYIPTGVISSAAFLNNRYLHLASILERQRIAYNRQLLWFYATMAYNKGTRSVLSLWNDARKRGGNELVEKLTNDPKAFFHAVFDPKTSNRFLSRIWSVEDAKGYGKELRIHMKNLRDCGMAEADSNNDERKF